MIKRIKDLVYVVAMLIGAAALIGIAIYSHASVWNECRETHSFLYCYSMMNK